MNKLKKLLIPVISCLLFHSTKILANEVPLLKKVYGGGNPELNWINLKTCEIYKNKVVIVKATGPLSTEMHQSLRIEGNIWETIEKVKKGSIKVENEMIWDRPVATYSIPAKEGDSSIMLKEIIYSEDGPLVRKVNDSKETEMLVRFLDENCF